MRSLTIVAWCGFLTALLPFLAIPIDYKVPAYTAFGVIVCVLSIVTRLRYLHFMEEQEALRREMETPRQYPLEYPTDLLSEESNA
jgi:hypothetical protein